MKTTASIALILLFTYTLTSAQTISQPNSTTCSSFLSSISPYPQSLDMCFEPFYSLQSSIRNAILAKNASLLTPAMDVYCAAPKCDDAAIRAVLASFVQQCPPDYIVPRANSSTMVQTYAKQFYEINYAHDTLCGKDANGIYCQVNEYTRLLSGSNSSQPLCNLCVKAAKINVISYIYTHPPADYPFLNGTAISASQNDTIALLNRTCGVDYSNSSLTFNGSIPVQTVGSTSAAPGRLDVEVVVPVVMATIVALWFQWVL
ncbi:hypothetical protein BC936DRAFT_145396 [Jimgerdemannia flammicorona]|uniref:Uncharacterized protein n=1 Tax=Jimgerdemannia flammicorona TaxID=994334 RepID=A0A433DA36_9FUNG|nr:hypothetical protein BC936DRAFT_145396 [Jimgerdemannia flammicorona]